MKKLLNGSLNDLQSQTDNRGWFIGHFIKDIPEFAVNEFEVGWGRRKKGYHDNNKMTSKSARTVTILIRGSVKYEFPQLNKSLLLSQEGEYIYFDTKDTDHTVEALKDSLVLTIRWPSKR